MPIVLITASEPVQYSTSIVGPPIEYDPGVLYDVPPHVADGMFVRDWARLATAADIEAAEQREREQQKPPQEANRVAREPSSRSPRENSAPASDG